MIEVNEYVRTNNISRKEYLKKYDSNVGYALYVQDNIGKDDYVRLNTGNIVRVIGIKANTVNKRAIYYGFYKQDWFDSTAVENFSDNIIDLIEVGDYVNGMEVLDIHKPKDLWEPIEIRVDSRYTNFILAEDIKTILTKEQMEANCYKVGGEE